jgi:hypothetical protein
VGYRLVATATLPSPAVNPFFWDEFGGEIGPVVGSSPGSCMNKFNAAPVYLGAQGSVEESIF